VIVGILTARLTIPEARSLKQKRHVLRSVKDRLRNDFNVSVAETGGQDLWQSAELAVAMVGTDRRYVNGALDQAVNMLRTAPGAILAGYEIEFF